MRDTEMNQCAYVRISTEDEIDRLVAENRRLKEENARIKNENEALKKSLGPAGPHGWRPT